MLSPDDFTYALENTRVILAPSQKLATFGTSLVNYYLVTEEMDRINHSRVREGQIHAEKPQLMSPAYFAKLMLEGFGEEARQYAGQISANAHQFTFLKYGFRMRKDDICAYDVAQSLEQVSQQIKADVELKDEPFTAVLTGVDDGWEVCLLKFMVDIIGNSAAGNLDDFRERGLL
jgi:hypothetical protein